jgi:hypothetical protein
MSQNGIICVRGILSTKKRVIIGLYSRKIINYTICGRKKVDFEFARLKNYRFACGGLLTSLDAQENIHHQVTGFN